MVGVITLAPFRFARPEHFRAAWIVLETGWLSDLLLNVALFLPLGFIARRSFSDASRSPRGVVLGAVLVSVAIETSQLFLAPRYTAASDVLANGVGALLGVWLSDAVGARMGAGRTLIGRLLLDLPLMGLVYLLIPLLWLDGLAAAGEPDRLWLLVPLVATGVLALAAVAESAGPPDVGDGHVMSGGLELAALLWYALGTAPALRLEPLRVGFGAVAVLAGALVARPMWRAAVRHDRRLEPQVVRLLLPLVLLYLTGTAMRGGTLHVAGGGEAARVGILRWLEGGAGFTLLGYLVAEWRGRREEALPRTVLVPSLVAIAVCLLLSRASAGLTGAPETIVAVIATMVGATLYAFQRGHILALLGRAEASET